MRSPRPLNPTPIPGTSPIFISQDGLCSTDSQTQFSEPSKKQNLSAQQGVMAEARTQLTAELAGPFSSVVLLWLLVGALISFRWTGTIDFVSHSTLALRETSFSPQLHEMLWFPWASSDSHPFGHGSGSATIPPEKVRADKDSGGSLQLSLSQLLTHSHFFLKNIVSKLCFPVVPKVWVNKHPRLLHLCSTLTNQ